jgi:hypothetical protein
LAPNLVHIRKSSNSIFKPFGELVRMTESKIRALFFTAGATAVWLLLAWLVTFGEAKIGAIATLVMIALFLTVLAMGQSEK